jgi:hypothetical protein
MTLPRPDDASAEKPIGRPPSAMARVLSGGVPFLAVATMVPLFYGRGRSLRDHFDDAYITYRFAIQLARGNGLVFNVGERIDAASSFLYTVVLAAFYRLGVHDLELLAVAIGALSAGGVAWVVSGAVQDVTDRRWLGAVVGLLAGANGLISGWAATGMESVFYTLLVTAFVSEVFVRRRESWASAALLTAVALTRVEGLILGVAWGLVHVIRMARQRVLRSRSPEATGVAGDPANRAFLLHGALAGAAVLAYFAFKYAYYGTLLPHTFHLKRLLRIYQPNPSDLYENWLRAVGGGLILALPGAVVLLRRRGTVVIGALVFLALTALTCTQGPSAGWARYSIQALPTVMIFAGVGVDWLLRKAAPIGVLALIGIAWQAATTCLMMGDGLRSFAPHQECRRKVGEYMNAHLDRSEVILSTDIGGIAYYAIDFSFIDTVGLTSIDVFDAYQAGASLDGVFQRRLPRFAADTWWLVGKTGHGEYKAHDKVARPGRMLTRPIAPTRFVDDLQDRGVMYQCDRGFAVGPLGRL